MTDEAALTTTGGDKSNAIVEGIAHAEKLGAWMARSNMFGCKTVEQGQVMAVSCIVMKIHPLQFMQTYHIVEGSPSMRADAMLAKFVTVGGDFIPLEWTDEACTIRFAWRKRETDYTFTIEEAKRAGLVKEKSGWDKWTKNMLYWRCVTNYLRAYVPEHFAGHYAPDEINADVVPTPSAPDAPVDVPASFMKPAEVVEVGPPATVDAPDIHAAFAEAGIIEGHAVGYLASDGGPGWLDADAIQDVEDAPALDRLTFAQKTMLAENSVAFKKRVDAWLEGQK